MNLHILILPVGFLLDLLLGDPRWLYHPICLVGNGITFLEKALRRILRCEDPGAHPRRELAGGIILALAVCLCSLGIPLGILAFLEERCPLTALFLEVFWCWQLLAACTLRRESMKVYKALADSDLTEARLAVSMIVGRDTAELTAEGVTKATVETIAENTSDGVTAPMFYMALLGIPGMFLYKAINTMDSMVGYKNDRYFYFGRWAAKLDDVANFIPARLTALLMIAASFLVGLDGKNGWRIFKRDRFCHASPNSAQTESVAAGALHVQLAGNAWYFGKLYEKPTIGDCDREIGPEDIPRMNRLMYGTAFLGAVCFTLGAIGIFGLARILG